MITDDELNKIQEYCDKATAGPYNCTYHETMGEQCWNLFLRNTRINIGTFDKHENANFFESARTDLPRVVQECRELNQQFKDLVEAGDKVADQLYFIMRERDRPNSGITAIPRIGMTIALEDWEYCKSEPPSEALEDKK